MPHTPRAWVLVANGSQAKIYAHHHVRRQLPMASNARGRSEEIFEDELVLVPGFEFHAEKKSDYDIDSDKTGRFSNVQASRHGNAPGMPIEEQIRRDFVKEISNALDHSAQSQERFDRLTLVAPAKILGELRKHLSPHVLACIYAEIQKDLTRLDEYDLAQHIF